MDTQTALAIVDKMNQFCVAQLTPTLCFLPRLETTVLPLKPYQAFRQGKHIKVPTIAGFNSEDPSHIRRSIVKSAREMEDTPVFLYKFNYKHSKLLSKNSTHQGVEIPFLFNTIENTEVSQTNTPLL